MKKIVIFSFLILIFLFSKVNDASAQIQLPGDLICGRPGNICCTSPNRPCENGLYCNSQRTCVADDNNCGGAGQPCCSNSSCPRGQNITCGANNTCTGGCGTPGMRCCTHPDPASQCTRYPSVICNAQNLCEEKCGESGQICCPGDKCNSGMECKSIVVATSKVCQRVAPPAPPPGPPIVRPGACTKDNQPGYQSAIGCITYGTVGGSTIALLRLAIGIGGGVAFLLILYSGFLITTSSGDPKRLQSGHDLLTSAIGGVLVVIFSIFILRNIGVSILGIM